MPQPPAITAAAPATRFVPLNEGDASPAEALSALGPELFAPRFASPAAAEAGRHGVWRYLLPLFNRAHAPPAMDLTSLVQGAAAIRNL